VDVDPPRNVVPISTAFCILPVATVDQNVHRLHGPLG
jgi:hypothetical protein